MLGEILKKYARGYFVARVIHLFVWTMMFMFCWSIFVFAEFKQVNRWWKINGTIHLTKTINEILSRNDYPRFLRRFYGKMFLRKTNAFTIFNKTFFNWRCTPLNNVFQSITPTKKSITKRIMEYTEIFFLDIKWKDVEGFTKKKKKQFFSSSNSRINVLKEFSFPSFSIHLNRVRNARVWTENILKSIARISWL